MRLPAPFSLTYPSLRLLSSLCAQQLSQSQRQVELYQRALAPVMSARCLTGWFFLLVCLLGRWWLILPVAILLLVLGAREKALTRELSGWERAGQAQRALPELGEQLHCLGLRDVGLIVQPAPPAEVSSRSEGSATYSELATDWITVQGTLADFQVQLILRDQITRYEYSGDPDTVGYIRDDSDHSSVSVKLSSHSLDPRLTRLRERIPEARWTPEGLLIQRAAQGPASLGQLAAVAREMAAWTELWEPGCPTPCPGCGQPLEGESCLACDATWLPRQSLMGKKLRPAKGAFGTRRCPGCQAPMEVVRVDQTPVETCQHCMGFWVSRNFKRDPVGSAYERAGNRSQPRYRPAHA